MRRRRFLTAAAALLALPLLAASPSFAQPIDVEAILHDPDAPTGGNPDGDVTIVAFLDYSCPYCRKSAPDLARIVAEDGRIRLVYKDWPILSEASVHGAHLALAAKYQGKYETAHAVLMAMPGRGLTAERMREAVAAAGIDMKQLDADTASHGAEITALLQRTLAQADSLSLQGTPTYLVGPLITSTLDYAGFKEAVAEARRRQAEVTAK